MDDLKVPIAAPAATDDERERARRTVTSAVGIPFPQLSCDAVFFYWRDIQVLRPSFSSASPTVMMRFKDAKANYQERIAKMWFPAHQTSQPEAVQALASEAYIYQHQIPLLLGTLPGSRQRTPCLVEAKEFVRCYISLDYLKEFLNRDIAKYPNNLNYFEQQFKENYFREQYDFLSKPAHMIVSVASKGKKFDDWFNEWNSTLLNEKVEIKHVPTIYNSLNNVLFQVIWTLTQLHRVCVVHNDLHLGNIFIETFDQPLRNEYYESWEEQGCGWLFPETKFRVLIYDWDRSAVSKVIGREEPPFNPLTSLKWDQGSRKWKANTICCSAGHCQDHRPAADLYFFVYQVVAALEYMARYDLENMVRSPTQALLDKAKLIKEKIAMTIEKLEMVSPRNQVLMKEFGGREDFRPSAVSKLDQNLLMENSSFGINDPIETVLQKAWSAYFQKNRPAVVGNVYKGLSPNDYQCNTHALDRIGTMCKFLDDEDEDSDEDEYGNYKAGTNPTAYGSERVNEPFSCNPGGTSEQVPSSLPSPPLPSPPAITVPQKLAATDDEIERDRRTVTSAAGTPLPQLKCDTVFLYWKDIQVLQKTSASPTVMVLFKDAKANNKEKIAKMWFPALQTKSPEAVQALASEAYIYQHQIPLLLGTLPGSRQRTPCLVAAEDFIRCTISLEYLKTFLMRDLAKYPNNLKFFEKRFGKEKYLKGQNEHLEQPVHMIVSPASKGVTLAAWLEKWSESLVAEKVEINKVPPFFYSLNNVIFQVIWTLTQVHRVCVVHNDLHFGNIFIEQINQPLRNEYYESWEEQGCGWLFPVTYFRALIYDWDRSAVLKVIGDEEPPFNPLTSLKWDKGSRKWKADANCCSQGRCQDHRPAADLYYFVFVMIGELEYITRNYVNKMINNASQAQQDKAKFITKQIATTIEKLEMVSPRNRVLMEEFGGQEDFRPSAVSKFDPNLLMENSSFGINDPIETILQKAWPAYFQKNRPAVVGNVYKGLSPNDYQCNTHALDRIGKMCQFLEDEDEDESHKAGANPKAYGSERVNEPFSCNPKRTSEQVPAIAVSQKLRKV